MVSMNRLTTERRAQIPGMMVEGNSIRAIVRMTGASKNTIVKRLEDAGEAFSAYQGRIFHDLPCKRIQLDEIWAYSYCKQRKVPFAKSAPEVAGDLWTWVALDADTSSCRRGASATGVARPPSSSSAISRSGSRSGCRLLASVIGPIWKPSRPALAQMSITLNSSKMYGEVPHPAGRYSPAQIQGTKTFCCAGDPDPKHISTSYVERQNLINPALLDGTGTAKGVDWSTCHRCPSHEVAVQKCAAQVNLATP